MATTVTVAVVEADPAKPVATTVTENLPILSGVKLCDPFRSAEAPFTVTLVAFSVVQVSTVDCDRKIGAGEKDAMTDGGAVHTCVAGL